MALANKFSALMQGAVMRRRATLRRGGEGEASVSVNRNQRRRGSEESPGRKMAAAPPSGEVSGYAPTQAAASTAGDVTAPNTPTTNSTTATNGVSVPGSGQAIPSAPPPPAPTDTKIFTTQ